MNAVRFIEEIGVNSVITSRNGQKEIREMLVQGKLGVEELQALVTIAKEVDPENPKKLPSIKKALGFDRTT